MEVALRSSLAIAITVYVPAETFVQFAAYGAFVARPSSIPLLVPSRYSTAVTMPSASLAFAVSATVEPGAYRLPSLGDVNATDGG